MGSVRNHWGQRPPVNVILAILTQHSYKEEVRGHLPNGEEHYKVIAEKGSQSMENDKALFWRAHYANGGDFGLPQGSGV